MTMIRLTFPSDATRTDKKISAEEKYRIIVRAEKGDEYAEALAYLIFLEMGMVPVPSETFKRMFL